MDPISVQMRELRAAREKARATGKPVKLDNRRGERFYKTPKGEWRKQIEGSTRSVKAKAPQAKYRDKSGRWRDARAKGAYSDPPRKFATVKIPRLKSTSHDAKGRARINAILDSITPNTWALAVLDAVEPRVNRLGKTIIGWRSRFEFDSNVPELTVFDDAARALLVIADDAIAQRAFAGRPSMVRCIFRSPEGYEQWLSLSSAMKFQIANKQGAADLKARAKRYTKYDKKGKPIREQSYVILRIRFIVQ